MTKSKCKDPRRQPILLVYPTDIKRYGDDVYSSICLAFRYYRGDCSHLQSYWLVEFEDAGGYYDGLTCEYRVNGSPRSQWADQFNGSLYPLCYDEAHSLGERKLTFMLKTLKKINSKLEAIADKEGATGSLSDYARRIAKIVKSKEIAIGHSRYSIEEGMQQIDNLIRDTRSRCLRLTDNSDECLEEQVKKWCDQNGYSDPQQVDGQWWAFPPNGVMQICIDSMLAG